jgi:hypothetical protein
MDRLVKPMLLARAEVGSYWRVETKDGIVVHTHRLDLGSDLFVPTGEFTDVIEVTEPWELSIPVDEIIPEWLR